MSAEKWVMIRVRVETHARIKKLKARLTSAYERGYRRSLPLGSRDVFSDDALLCELLTMKEDHLARSNRRKRPRETPPAVTGLPGTGDEFDVIG